MGEKAEIEEKDINDLDIGERLFELVEKDALKIKKKIAKYLNNLHAKSELPHLGGQVK